MKIYVDKDVNIFEGEAAEKLLKEHNDKQYFIKNVGVPKVDIERWNEAQSYERKTWCDSAAKNMETDHNEEHEKHFGGYEELNFMLPNTYLNIIELGCGPFTNLRLIVPKIYHLPIKNIDLLDPLINEYINHSPSCAYKNGYLNMLKVNLYNCAIENYITTKEYQLVVMINVIEHCFDVDEIFKKISNILCDNGIFIFHDKFIKEKNIDEFYERIYDSGHPLKLTYKYIEDIIETNFKTLYTKSYIDQYDNECIYKILKK